MAPARTRPVDVALDALVLIGLLAALLTCLWLVSVHGFAGMGIAGMIGAFVACAVLLSYGRSMRTRRPTHAR